MKTLKYAVRFLVRSRSYSLINLFGLAFSLACCIILLRYIHRETSVDIHCVNRERVVVPLRGLNQIMPSISCTQYSDTLFIPDNQIVRRSKLDYGTNELIKYQEQNYRVNALYADTCFLQLFDYPLVEGSNDLSAPNHAVITRNYAQRLFGKESPIGKVLEYEKESITINGVIDNPSCKTLLNFDILISRQSQERPMMEFLEVLPSVDLEAVNKVSNVLRRFKIGDRYTSISHRYEFVTLKDLYFKEVRMIDHMERYYTFGSSDYLNILFIVAVLLLFVGIMNFINLYMVYMMKRQKEYGIKKVYGLQKWPLFVQIWSENVLLAFWALMVAWLIIEITQIPIARLLGTEMAYSPFDLQLSLGFLLVLPLITSIYPYIRYQYMSPITSMRSIVTNRQSVVTRMLFLGVQYTVTFVLMVFSLYLNKHFRFMLNTSPGFRTERILEANITDNVANLNDLETSFERITRAAEKINACPDIEYWTQSGNILKNLSVPRKYYNEKDEPFEINTIVDFSSDFMKMYDLKVIAGELPDSANHYQPHFVINRAALKLMGGKHLDETFIRSESGTMMEVLADGSQIEHGKSLQPVTAVIEDFYQGHITEGVKPMVGIYETSKGISTGKFYLQVREGKEQAVIHYLRQVAKEVNGTEEFEYKWMDEYVREIYDEDRRVATIYSVFALIAIGVSCLGLFGISLFDIRQRYREIGIRKVNGAGMKDLYKLLFRKYVLILGVSFIIAIPLAWYAIYTYTADFVVKAPVGIGIFVIALLLVALISMGTLWWQIRKAANINPSLVMKRE